MVFLRMFGVFFFLRVWFCSGCFIIDFWEPASFRSQLRCFEGQKQKGRKGATSYSATSPFQIQIATCPPKCSVPSTYPQTASAAGWLWKEMRIGFFVYLSRSRSMSPKQSVHPKANVSTYEAFPKKNDPRSLSERGSRHGLLQEKVNKT